MLLSNNISQTSPSADCSIVICTVSLIDDSASLASLLIYASLELGIVSSPLVNTNVSSSVLITLFCTGLVLVLLITVSTGIVTLPLLSASKLLTERTIFLSFHLRIPDGSPERVAECAESAAFNKNCPAFVVYSLP